LLSTDLSSDSKDRFLLGHVIDGRALLPATAHLVFAWKLFARYMQGTVEDVPVQFNNVSIHRATVLPEAGKEHSICRYFYPGPYL